MTFASNNSIYVIPPSPPPQPQPQPQQQQSTPEPQQPQTPPRHEPEQHQDTPESQPPQTQTEQPEQPEPPAQTQDAPPQAEPKPPKGPKRGKKKQPGRVRFGLEPPPPQQQEEQAQQEHAQGPGNIEKATDQAPHGAAPAPAPTQGQGYLLRYTPSPLPRWEATPRRHEYFSGEYRSYYPTPVREGIYRIATDANRLTTIFSEENPNACTIV